jgi:processive 1,2-diacylglycerol beta-glucosyltransferase
MAQKKILFLTAPYGNGHLQPTKVLAKQFEAQGFTTKTYDIVEEWNPQISKIAQGVYKTMYKAGMRRFYQFWYWATDQEFVGTIVTTFLKHTNKRHLKAAIDEFNPSAIICVFPTWALYKLLEDYEITVPVYTVVTDFYMHKLWYHQNLKKVFIANDWTYYTTNFTADKQKFVVTGIPIKPEFEQTFQRNIEDRTIKHTVLLIAGANGVNTEYLSLAKRILDLPFNLDVTLICGRNKSLHTKAQHYKETENISNFHVLGYTNKMIEKYEAADIVITKSGGNTVSELAALAKPAIFYNPLYGQEMANAHFFEQQGVAKTVMSKTEAIEALEMLYTKPQQIVDMREKFQKFFIPNAAGTIVAEVEMDLK